MLNLKDTDLLKRASYIDGDWQTSDQTYAVLNPSNGDLVASVTDAGIVETEQAVLAAKAALPAWSAKSAAERC